jgi:hypothetical protein
LMKKETKKSRRGERPPALAFSWKDERSRQILVQVCAWLSQDLKPPLNALPASLVFSGGRAKAAFAVFPMKKQFTLTRPRASPGPRSAAILKYL